MYTDLWGLNGDEYEEGYQAGRRELARTLTRLRKGNVGAGDYKRALDDVADTHGIKSKTVTTVEYTA
jgi:hypothetical protein